MASIRQLPPGVINKIAAGEVIERPASVVKELMENAVDAHARRIDVAVEQGGATRIRVADDGGGISADELPLAVASHATSKIHSADDLFAVATLGFRGEALASIAEVSHFRLQSREPQAEAGAALEVQGGIVGEVQPCGCPVGSVVEVRNLFFNTPVRRKFLRTTQTEMGHLAEAFTRLALAHSDIHFTLRHNDRSLFDLPAVQRWQDRLGAFFGEEVRERLIWVESRDETVVVSGYVGEPGISRANNRLQYLFLNGRFIRDRALQHALGEAYRGLLMSGRFPIAFLRLELPPDAIDVNVHPTKLEVRLQEGNRVYSHLLGTLRQKFLSSDLTARVQPAAEPRPGGPPGMDAPQWEQHRQRVSQWARGAASSGPALVPPEDRQAQFEFPRPAAPASLPRGGQLSDFRPFPSGADGAGALRGDEHLRSGDEPAAPAGRAPHPATPAPDRRTPHPAGLQLHDRYLVTESDEGMLVIDQHALHERILYEQLREKVLAGRLETQKLLVPEPVTLTAEEAAAVLDAQPTLLELGMQVEPFGGDTILISSYPAMLANLSPREVLRQVMDLLVSGTRSPDRRDLLDELLHMISCKAAVKAGDHLSAEEVDALLEQRELYRDTHHCPHGRPTALIFTREELDKRFKRT